MSANNTSLSFRIDRPTREKLLAEAERSKIEPSRLLREIVRQWLGDEESNEVTRRRIAEIEKQVVGVRNEQKAATVLLFTALSHLPDLNSVMKEAQDAFLKYCKR